MYSAAILPDVTKIGQHLTK